MESEELSVSIKEIHIRNLGPLNQISMKLGALNLIFGLNEHGKTYLVEFLIRSLFRPSSHFKFREDTGSGKVIVQGLDEDTMIFSPVSDRKLDDYMEKIPGLPPDLSRLIVVKGADTGLTGQEDKVSRRILNQYLSGQKLLDLIESRISKTIQETSVLNGIIQGPKRKEIRDREGYLDSLNRIDRLLERIDSEYSGGSRGILLEQKNSLSALWEETEKAKRFLAFELNSEIGKLETESLRIPEAVLKEMQGNLRFLEIKRQNCQKKVIQKTEAEEKCRHYEWLSEAAEIYEKMLEKKPKRPCPILLVLSVVLAICVLVFSLLRILPGAVISLFLAVLCTVWYLVLAHRRMDHASFAGEAERLKANYRQRFGVREPDLAEIRERLHGMEEFRTRAKLAVEELATEEKDMHSLELKIGNWIEEITGQRKDPDSWNKVLGDLDRKQKSLMEQKQKLKMQLAGLNVDPSDYERERPAKAYHKKVHDETGEKLSRVEKQLAEETHKLDTLKHEICQHTGDSMATAWEDLIDHLRLKRREIRDTYSKNTAEIIGKRAVYEILGELRKDENTKIEESLRSPVVQEALPKITGHYSLLKFRGGDLAISDEEHEFLFSELSSGAQEQVLLALRMGLIQRCMGQNPFFLILDDAFQYSDWERRIFLVDYVIGLVRNDWQVIYLTMDDHIRSCFEERGKILGKNYRQFTL